MAKVLANGVQFNVQQLGSGRPVVFIHGLVMDNLSSWYFSVANRVAKEARAILYDLRGHGMSERPASGYRLDDQIEDLRAMLDAIEVDEPVAIVGNSFGGLLAIAFAVAHPERVDRLILVDAHVSGAGWGDAMASTLELEGEAADQMIADTFKDWLGRHSERKRNRLARNARELVYETTMLKDLRESAVLSDDILAELACPVLAMYGENSDALAQGEHLARTLPNCQLRLFAGCTHSIIWEATDRVRDAIVDWLTPAAPARRVG